MKHHEFSEDEVPDDQPSLPELDCLREIQAPQETQLAIRTAIGERSMDQASRRDRWWSQTICVPVPVVIACGLLIAALPIINISPNAEPIQTTQTTTVPTTPPPELVSERVVVASASYLCGVGTLQSETALIYPEEME